jgi:hypothetical protein
LSTSTRTNAWYSLDIIQEQQQQDKEDGSQQQQQQHQQQRECLLVVTSPFHQLRSYYTFKRAVQQKGLRLQVGLSRGGNSHLSGVWLQLLALTVVHLVNNRKPGSLTGWLCVHCALAIQAATQERQQLQGLPAAG